MSLRAAVWVGLYLALVLVPLLILIAGPMPPGREFLWDFSMGLGFAAMAMLGVQFALTARFKRMSAPFGIDIIYLFHRYLALIAVGLALAHFAILWLFYEEALGDLDPRTARWELTAARVALVMFVLAVITSEFRTWLRINYDWWRIAHIVFATIGFAAAIAHIVGVGYYTEAPGKRMLWLVATGTWLLVLVWVRIARPAMLQARPYRVAEVRSEAGNTWTLALEPAGHSGLRRFMPGQFAWLTLHRSPFFVSEHPFSIVSAPEVLPRIEFGIKELGDFTGGIGRLRPGEIAYLDGPYGVFSIDRHRTAPGLVGIVGGIGITPLISMLRSLAARRDPRPVWLFYANKTLQEAAYRDELDRLGEQLNLTLVDILEQAPEDWAGETGFVREEVLDRHLPRTQRIALHYFLCGPPPMTKAAEEALHAFGVPAHRIHTEVFALV
ncbi:MAG: ferric reductase-like transmembrane domain-containing protein [Alphaproteobacteria bacterium]